MPDDFTPEEIAAAKKRTKRYRKAGQHAARRTIIAERIRAARGCSTKNTICKKNTGREHGACGRVQPEKPRKE